jgi:hypothetical protein
MEIFLPLHEWKHSLFVLSKKWKLSKFKILN